jgi:hypothetical protein
LRTHRQRLDVHPWRVADLHEEDAIIELTGQ